MTHYTVNTPAIQAIKQWTSLHCVEAFYSLYVLTFGTGIMGQIKEYIKDKVVSQSLS